MTQIPTRDERAVVAQQRLGDVVVLRPHGAFDEALAAEVRMLTLEARAPVVVDLDHCQSFSASAVARLASWELLRPELCVVCGGPGDRRMLQASHDETELAVFATVEEALAARAGRPGGWAGG